MRERAPNVLRYTLPDYIKRSTAEYIQSGLCGRGQFRSPSSLWKRKELRLKTMVLERISSGVWTKKRSNAATKSYGLIRFLADLGDLSTDQVSINLLWQSFLVLVQPVQFIQISEVAQEPQRACGRTLN